MPKDGGMKKRGDNLALASSGHRKHRAAPLGGRSLPSREESLSFNRVVSSTTASMLQGQGAVHVADGIPKLPLGGTTENCDSVAKLRIQAVPAQDCALVSPLRFSAPEDFHIPPVVEALSCLPLARRVITLLRGAECFPIVSPKYRRLPNAAAASGDATDALCPIQPDGNDKAHMSEVRDVEMRARAALRSGNSARASRLFTALGCIYYNYGSLEKAATNFEKALREFELIGDATGAILCNNFIGVCYFRLGEYKMSLVYHKKQEPLGGPYARAVAQINMSVAYIALKELEFAEQALQDGIENARKARDAMLETIALGNMGVVSLRVGNMRAAQLNLEQCLEHCSVAGDKSGAAVCLLLLGEIYLDISDYSHALFYFEHALRIGSETGIADIVAVARVNIGVAKGNAALRDCILKHAQAMGHENGIETVISALPR